MKILVYLAQWYTVNYSCTMYTGKVELWKIEAHDTNKYTHSHCHIIPGGKFRKVQLCCQVTPQDNRINCSRVCRMHFRTCYEHVEIAPLKNCVEIAPLYLTYCRHRLGQ